VPTSVKVLSATIVPITSIATCLGTDYGIAIKIRYQVLDQKFTPILSSSMVPQEELLNVSVNGSLPINLIPNWVNLGPNQGMTSIYTDATGGFWDDPFGACSNVPITETSQQPLAIQLSGTVYPVRTNNWTISAGTVGHGSISNGGDI
jgi:hypothetical protein